MHRHDFFVALSRAWQLIKTLKSKTLASEIDTDHGRYMIEWHVFSCNFAFIFNLLMYKQVITGDFNCSWQNLLWKTKSWRYSISLFMKIENCWKLKLLKFLQALLTVSVIIFCNIIFRFAVYCFNQRCEQCKGFFWAKDWKIAIWRKIDFRIRTEW